MIIKKYKKMINKRYWKEEMKNIIDIKNIINNIIKTNEEYIEFDNQKKKYIIMNWYYF